jgi:Nuclease-related domain
MQPISLDMLIFNNVLILIIIILVLGVTVLGLFTILALLAKSSRQHNTNTTPTTIGQSEVPDPEQMPLLSKPGNQFVTTPDLASQLPSMPNLYNGPTIVNGNKYAWESRWSHLPSFEEGREAQERVINSLATTLDAEWYVFRDFTLPTESEDIDLVLVGPGGLFAVEVRTSSNVNAPMETGSLFAEAGNHPNGKERHAWEPNAQINNAAHRLGDYLGEHGIKKAKITPIVVAVGEAEKDVQPSDRETFKLDDVPARMREIVDRTELKRDQVEEVANVLRRTELQQPHSSLTRLR